MPRRDMQDLAVVITGASSGIGRATALTFARRGAKLLLAARRGDLLLAVERECRALGADARAWPADVTDAEAMRKLAAGARRRFGRLDVWVNNAGVGALGRFTAVPAEAHDQVVRTNLLGAMHGAHAALREFSRRGKGVLINVISMGGWVPAPLAASYSASKYGMRGLSESLRGEVSRFPDIHVCDVLPSLIDTTGIGHAANYTGRQLTTVPPTYPAQRVADAIVELVTHPRDTVTIGAPAITSKLGYAVAPAFGRWLITRAMERGLSKQPSAAMTAGNLKRPVRTGRDVAEAGSTVRSGFGARVVSFGFAGAIFAAIIGAAMAADTRAAASGR